MSVTIDHDGVLSVAYPGQPNETHVLQDPIGEKWDVLADGSTGALTLTDGSTGFPAAWTIFDENGTPWSLTVDTLGLLKMEGFDRNILVAPVINSPIKLNGVAAEGYQLFAFVAGTTTHAQTYRHYANISLQPTPIVLNEFGLPTDAVFLISGELYDFALIPPDGGPAVKEWRSVKVGPPSLTSSITQWLNDDISAAYLSPSSFTVSGDSRDIFRPGRRLQLVQSSTIYGIVSSVAYVDGVTTISVLVDSTDLDPALTVVRVGLLSPPYGAIPGRRHIRTATFLLGNATLPLSDGFNLLTAGTMGIMKKPVPAGWLECNGQAVSRTGKAALFASISTTFGAGDGSTTFNVPNIATTGMGANALTTNDIIAGNLVYVIYAQG